MIVFMFFMYPIIIWLYLKHRHYHLLYRLFYISLLSLLNTNLYYSLIQGGSDTLKLAQFGLDRIGVGLVTKPFTDILRADLENNQKFGKFSNTKNIWNHPNKYFQKVGWNALAGPVDDYIPNSDSVVQGIGSIIIHGNAKTIKNSLLNYPSNLYSSVIDT